jgi:hypothetical protein
VRKSVSIFRRKENAYSLFFVFYCLCHCFFCVGWRNREDQFYKLIEHLGQGSPFNYRGWQLQYKNYYGKFYLLPIIALVFPHQVVLLLLC